MNPNNDDNNQLKPDDKASVPTKTEESNQQQPDQPEPSSLQGALGPLDPGFRGQSPLANPRRNRRSEAGGWLPYLPSPKKWAGEGARRGVGY